MTDSPEPLSRLLRRADPGAAASASIPTESFVAAVHARLRAETLAPSLWQRFFARQALPLAASLTVLASLAAGGTVAYAREQRARTEASASAYARSIDPWQLRDAPASPAAPAHHHP
jgi:hypothetical protein